MADTNYARVDPAEIARRFAGIHDTIAADLAPHGGILRCRDCGTEEPLGDVAKHLRTGWPDCCGHTMTWITQRLLNEEKTDGRN